MTTQYIRVYHAEDLSDIKELIEDELKRSNKIVHSVSLTKDPNVSLFQFEALVVYNEGV